MGLSSSPTTSGVPDDAGTVVKGNKKTVSAAEHTHDKGYKKWDKFDVDAALRDVDEDARGAEQARRELGNVSFPTHPVTVSSALVGAAKLACSRRRAQSAVRPG